MSNGSTIVGSPTSKLTNAILLYGAFAFAIIVMLFPIFSVLMLSMKSRDEVFAWPPTLFPEVFNLATYRYILFESAIGTNLVNSLKLTFFSVIGCLLISTPAAYAFSRMSFRFDRTILFLLLIYQMISSLVIAIPLYRYFDSLGLLDTHLGVILIYITVEIPFTVWLLKGFFDAIPPSLDEAARIDGASRMQAMWIVILPLAKPGLAAALIFNVISTWSQFIVAVHPALERGPDARLGRRPELRAGPNGGGDHHPLPRRRIHRRDGARADDLHRAAAVHRPGPDRRRRQGLRPDPTERIAPWPVWS